MTEQTTNSCSTDPAFTCRKQRGAWLLVIIALVLAVDLMTKIYAMEHLRETAQNPIVYLSGLLRIQYAENPGAFLSLLANLDPNVRFWILTVMNGAILIGLGVYLLISKTLDRWSWIALALILGGGLGNLIDRICYDGHVIDFLNMGIGELRTGIFNVADIGITAGFIMLLPKLFSSGNEPAASKETPREPVTKGQTESVA